MNIVENTRKDFKIFKKNRGLVYLDSAATAQVPKQVLRAIRKYKERDNANTSRGVYDLAERSSDEYENSRRVVAKFIGAKFEEIIFTRNTTESLNVLANILSQIIPSGKNEIVLTEMEHHSNLIPWQEMAKKNKMKLKFIKLKNDFTLDVEDAKNKITAKTAIVSFAHVSNVLGTVNPIEELVKFAKSKKAISIIDSAQGVPHREIDVKKIGCDFLAFSSHKMLGPMGIGVLYGRKELLEKLYPNYFGGGMVKSSTFESANFVDSPNKFEAGTQNVEGAVGIRAAIEYLQHIGMKNIENYENQLFEYAIAKLKEIDGISIYAPKKNGSGIISFNLKGVHPHDVASMLNDYNIAIRAGHCCAIPLMKKLDASGVCRISFYVYTTQRDIDKLIFTLKKVWEKFK